MITPICGFKDSRGRFHATEDEALAEEKQYMLHNLRSEAIREVLGDGNFYSYAARDSIGELMDAMAVRRLPKVAAYVEALYLDANPSKGFIEVRPKKWWEIWK